MRIPLNWLKEYVNLPEKQEDLTHQLTMAGHMLDKVDHINGVTVLDLELRGNRADCYSILGIAREVSALFKTPINYPKTHKSFKKVAQLSDVRLDIKTDLVKRVMMAVIKDVAITESPKWLKEKVEQYGIPSINNIVDLSNYVMIETGEPMHTFDLDKVGKELQIRLAKKGERMTTFLGKELTLTAEELVWANKKDVLSVAGAIGGKHHSISGSTKNVLLEAANYDRANIRRSIHRLNLLTDAGIRHEKELDPNLVDLGIYRFLQLLLENEWGTVEPEIIDYYPNPMKPWKISLSYDYLSSLSGFAIDKKKVKDVLKWLNFTVVKETSKEIQVLVPAYRTDVTLEEDLIEEILRILSYDQIPTQTLSLEIPEDVTPPFIKQEEKVKEILVALGFDEVISIPFVQEKNLLLNKNLPDRPVSPVRVTNRPSPDFEELRMSMFPNLYEFTRKIINERGQEARIFEVGRIYAKKGGEYIEKRKVGIIYWEKQANFPEFKGYLEGLFERMQITGVKYKDANSKVSILDNPFFINVKTDPVGLGGMYKSMYFAQIDLDAILGKEGKLKALLWPKYPPQIEVITLNIPERTKIGEVVDILRDEKVIQDVQLITIYNNAYTFRMWYQHPQKTLTDREVEEIKTKVLANLKKKFGITFKN